MGVYRSSNNLTAKLAEFLGMFTEGDDLRGTDEGEVQGIEEQHNIFTCQREFTLACIGAPFQMSCKPASNDWEAWSLKNC